VKASEMKEYQHLVEKAIAYGRSKIDYSNECDLISLILDKLFVIFGKEIL
jgi:hypothetical protein